MIEVRRDDGELCGYVTAHAGTWRSTTVFGVVLAQHDTELDARHNVVAHGLNVLADRWTLIDGAGEEQVVCIQQASPDEVTVALDYYSMPGVPTLTIATDDLIAGTWRLEHRS
jgi:hypothetical protein